MKPKLYLETTVPSYYVARPSRDLIVAAQQQQTQEWWERRRDDFDIQISQVVLDEAKIGDAQMAKQRLGLLRPFPLLTINPEVVGLANALIRSGPLPSKAARDATHIALSAVYGIHFLLSWNCTHIANAKMFGKIGEVCEAHGFDCPVICTPAELLAK